MNQERNKKLVFPEYTSEIISQLMKEYKISESIDQIFDKMEKGEKTKGRKIANLLREVVYGRLLKKDLPLEIEKRLNISEIKAMDLAKDLQEKILLPMETTPPKTTPQIKEEIKKRPKDIYREPIR